MTADKRPSSLMGPDILQRAACVLAPRANLTACLATANTNSAFIVPDQLKGRFCTFTMDGDDADFAFVESISSTALVYGQVSAVDGSTKVVTFNAATGGHMKDGVARTAIVPNDDKHGVLMVINKSAASAKLYIEAASPQ